MSPYTMPHLVVLVPGIAGSVLKKNGTVVWGYSAGTIARALGSVGGSAVESLSLPQDDPELDMLGDGIVAEALMPDLHLLPGIWKIDGYTKAANAIKAAFDVTAGKNFFTFPYDWRRDNRVAARNLARASHGWLAAWREASGNPDARLILVAHSMGGLVCRYFLECLEGWRLTKALVTFGTPYRGALDALDGLANGVRKGPVNLTPLVRQFSSIYQLLPIFPCYDSGDGTLVRVGEASGIPNVDPGRAADALAFHREIESAVASNRRLPGYQAGGYRLYPIVGIAQQTNLSARLSNGRVEMLPTYEGKALGGDGRVPRVSAIPIELGDGCPDAVYSGTCHGSLQNADAVIMHLVGLLSGYDLDLGSFRKPRSPVSLEVEDVFGAGEPVEVRMRAGAAGLTWRASLRSADDRTLESVQVTQDGADWMVCRFAPPPGGAYRVLIEGDDVETVEDATLVLATDCHE